MTTTHTLHGPGGRSCADCAFLFTVERTYYLNDGPATQTEHYCRRFPQAVEVSIPGEHWCAERAAVLEVRRD